jgi:hypothetical protein
MKSPLGTSLYPSIITSIWALISLIVILSSLYLTDGRLVYTLDDPYIALKLANVVLGGGYGINASEHCSPSSSILYPLMLVVTQRLGLGSAGPLVLDAIAAGSSVYLGSLFIERYVLGGAVTRKTALFAYPLGVLMIFAFSAVALPMTGLEHSWHILLIVVILFEFARMLSTRSEASASLVAAIVLTPLIRFEGVALSFAAIVALGYVGRWKAALTAAALVVLAFGAYAAAMVRFGLPILPSSVTSKSDVAANVGDMSGGSAVAKAILHNLTQSLRIRQGQLLLLMSILMLGTCAITPAGRARRASAVIAGVAVAALFAHLLGGRYGWFGRYEVYAMALGSLALLFTLRFWLQDWLEHSAWNLQTVRLLAVLAGMAFVVNFYVKTAIQTPVAAEGVYHQQFQMHRFATDIYKQPVAVNDLGWVSYQNNAFVLDLQGLGSEPVRRLRAAHAFGAAQMAELASRYKIGLVIIYESWYPDIPSTWKRVAVLHAKSLTSADDNVSFFVTPDADLKLASQALAELQQGLPRGVTLDVEPI